MQDLGPEWDALIKDQADALFAKMAAECGSVVWAATLELAVKSLGEVLDSCKAHLSVDELRTLSGVRQRLRGQLEDAKLRAGTAKTPAANPDDNWDSLY